MRLAHDREGSSWRNACGGDGLTSSGSWWASPCSRPQPSLFLRDSSPGKRLCSLPSNSLPDVLYYLIWRSGGGHAAPARALEGSSCGLGGRRRHRPKYVGAHTPLDLVEGATLGVAAGCAANLVIGVPPLLESAHEARALPLPVLQGNSEKLWQEVHSPFMEHDLLELFV